MQHGGDWRVDLAVAGRGGAGRRERHGGSVDRVLVDIGDRHFLEVKQQRRDVAALAAGLHVG
jgi:hypothetical protein